MNSLRTRVTASLLALVGLLALASGPAAADDLVTRISPEARFVGGINLRLVREHVNSDLIKLIFTKHTPSADGLAWLNARGLRLFRPAPGKRPANVDEVAFGWQTDPAGQRRYVLVLSGPFESRTILAAIQKAGTVTEEKDGAKTLYRLDNGTGAYVGLPTARSVAIASDKAWLLQALDAKGALAGNKEMAAQTKGRMASTHLFLAGQFQPLQQPKNDDKPKEDDPPKEDDKPKEEPETPAEPTAPPAEEGSVSTSPQVRAFLFQIKPRLKEPKRGFALSVDLICPTPSDAGALKTKLDQAKKEFARRWFLLPKLSRLIQETQIREARKHTVPISLELTYTPATSLLEMLVPLEKPEETPPETAEPTEPTPAPAKTPAPAE